MNDKYIQTDGPPCCAHRRIVSVLMGLPEGKCSEHWECNDCGTRFAPVTKTPCIACHGLGRIATGISQDECAVCGGTGERNDDTAQLKRELAQSSLEILALRERVKDRDSTECSRLRRVNDQLKQAIARQATELIQQDVRIAEQHERNKFGMERTRLEVRIKELEAQNETLKGELRSAKFQILESDRDPAPIPQLEPLRWRRFSDEKPERGQILTRNKYRDVKSYPVIFGQEPFLDIESFACEWIPYPLDPEPLPVAKVIEPKVKPEAWHQGYESGFQDGQSVIGALRKQEPLPKQEPDACDRAYFDFERSLSFTVQGGQMLWRTAWAKAREAKEAR